MIERTICRSLVNTVALNGDQTACQSRLDGRWISYTWNEYLSHIELTALALRKLEVGPGTRVALFSNSRMEWAVSDWAILALHAVTVPIYQSVTNEDLQFILHDSQSEVVICENERSLQKLLAIKDDLPKLRYIVVLSPLPSAPQFVFTWSQLMDIGDQQRKINPMDICAALEGTKSQDVISFIYTSGTTGRPKGVVLTHEQAYSEVSEAFPLLGINSKDQSLSFLPYAHVMGRIEHWGHGLIGYKMAFCPSVERIKEYLAEVKPTVIIAVPRLFEKIYSGILAQIESQPLKKKVFLWAMNLGRQVSQNHIDGVSTSVTTLAQYRLAKELVFRKIYEQLGGRLRFAVSGGAPLSQDLAQFYHALGVLVLEGYGLTETTAAVCVNTPFEFRFGTVGKPFGDVEVRIAEDGEVLVKSKKVMREYLNDTTSTQQVLQAGWFHTGDIGEFDHNGYLRITDRKKDLIKTAGGKYVAPQKLEALLKASPLVSNVLIHGDQKKYVTALVTINPATLKSLAENLGLATADLEFPGQSTKLKEHLRKHFAKVNGQLASFETIKNFAILNADFTVESGELTPSLKVKRKVVSEKYKDLIESLYT
jgi:long-chain acyl-CoA synthetase